MAMNPAQAIDEEGGPTSAQRSHAQALPIGTRLRDYEITVLVGEGAFSVVYLAWDHSLQRKVAIKEYLPAEMASRISGSAAVLVRSDRQRDVFKAGLKAFVNEARLLARFDHPSLLKVYRFWEENGTAYMAMPFYEGPTLKTALAEPCAETMGERAEELVKERHDPDMHVEALIDLLESVRSRR